MQLPVHQSIAYCMARAMHRDVDYRRCSTLCCGDLHVPVPYVIRVVRREEMAMHSARYLDMGVQPVWVDEYEEIPDIIRSLK